MNLYNFHSKSENLDHYEEAHEAVPEIFFDISKDKDYLKNKEKSIARSGEFSLSYALYVLKDRFPLGEPAIAKDASRSFVYAQNILKGRFKLGEPAMIKDPIINLKYSKFLDEIE